VAGSKRLGKTSLSEAQARALADWWRGKYHQVNSPDCPGSTCHGVIIESCGTQDLANPTAHQRTIFSLEEARLLEQARGHDNPGATDWVG
jgi:hypothetical protein